MVECGTFAQDAQDRDGLALVGFSSSSCGTPGLGGPQPHCLAPDCLGNSVCPGIGESALAQSTRMAHAVMPVQMKRLYVSGVRKFLAERCEGGRWTWAGGCSGTDVVKLSFKNIQDYWHESLGLFVDFQQTFAAEKDEAMQAFLLDQGDSPVVYPANSCLKARKGLNLRTGRMSLVPHARCFTGGFSCKNKSPASSKRKQYRTCVQDKDTSACTTATYLEMTFWCWTYRPDCIAMENLKETDHKGGDEEISHSDAEWIVSDWQAHGYAAMKLLVLAEGFESLPTRTRMFFIGYEGNTHENRVRLSHVAAMVRCMHIGPGDFDTILLTAEQMVWYYGTPARPPPLKKARSDPLYKDDHMEVYQACGLMWPPDVQSLHHGIKVATGTALPVRQLECAYIYDTLWPASQGTAEKPATVWHSVDLNEGLKRTLRWDDCRSKEELSSPWVFGRLGHLTGTTQWLLRRWVTDSMGARAEYRMLGGIEAMRCIGWDLDSWQEVDGSANPFNNELITDATLLKAAGNAYSAFATTPLLSALMAGMGIDVAAAVEVPSSAASGDSGEDGSESD